MIASSVSEVAPRTISRTSTTFSGMWDQDVEVHQVGYLTDQLGARAVDAVNSYAKSGQPFLISLHFNAPHWPWEGPGDEAESKRLRARPCATSTVARRRLISA